MGILYIVSTPIGNLQDITIRAIQVLRSVDFIACENTRKASILLKSIQGKISIASTNKIPELISYHEHNEKKRIDQIINALYNKKSVALVSDAGTPTISDPGFKLVKECVKLGIRIESIPGPCSLITALVVSGLPTDKFLFVGYLPRKLGHRKKFLKNIQASNIYIESTIILFESPHRLIKTLQEMQNVYGDINIVIARELTKIHEEIKRGLISEIIKYYSSSNGKLRGEIVILFSFKT